MNIVDYTRNSLSFCSKLSCHLSFKKIRDFFFTKNYVLDVCIYSVKNKKMSINQRSSTVVPQNFRLEVEKLLRNILMVVVQVAYFHSEIKSVIKNSAIQEVK